MIELLSSLSSCSALAVDFLLYFFLFYSQLFFFNFKQANASISSTCWAAIHKNYNPTKHFTEAHHFHFHFTFRKLIISLKKNYCSLPRLTFRTRVLRTRPSLLHFSHATLSVTLLWRIGAGSVANSYSPATRLRALGPTWPLGPGPIHISRACKYSVFCIVSIQC